MEHDFPPAFLDAIDRAVLDRDGRPERDEIRFRCPADGHPDEHPSARWNREKAVWRCDVCNAHGGCIDLARRLGIPRPETVRQNGHGHAHGTAAHAPSRGPFEHSNTSAGTRRDSRADSSNANPNGQSDVPWDGLTLTVYATAKRLPVDFLRRLDVRDCRYLDKPAVRMAYRNPDGIEGAVRFRVALSGKDRFLWKKGTKARLYGLDRLAEARVAGYVVVPEGESDAHTCWYHGIPAVALPGAGTWNEVRDAPLFDGIGRIVIPVEPDQGGAAVLDWLAKSRIRDRAWLLDLSPFGVKDLSALHVADPAQFSERFDRAIAAARVWADRDQEARTDEAAEALALGRELLEAPDLLDRVGDAMQRRGFAGDLRPSLLGYVALTSRLLERPQNIAYIAQSGAGKNRAVDEAREFVPAEAVYIVKAGSARALIYNDESFEHRTVVYAEADSIPEDGPAASAVRNLASDNTMEYEVVERNEQTGRWETRKIVKPGPTGLITTSTRSLGEQLGTRLLEVSIPDDAEQTRNVMRAHAAAVMPTTNAAIDLAPFIAAQRWLELAGERRVAVPFAGALAGLVPADAVRMRRDFRQLLTCVQTIALLHQRQRQRTPEGWIIADIADYAAARELLAPIFDTVVAEGLTPAVRATIEAVGEVEEVSLTDLAARLKLAKGTTSWRVRRAIEGGWLVNREQRKGYPAKLTRGLPLPEESSALPPPERVREVFECSNRPGVEDTAAPCADDHATCAICGAPVASNSLMLCDACERRAEGWAA